MNRTNLFACLVLLTSIHLLAFLSGCSGVSPAPAATPSLSTPAVAQDAPPGSPEAAETPAGPTAAEKNAIMDRFRGESDRKFAAVEKRFSMAKIQSIFRESVVAERKALEVLERDILADTQRAGKVRSGDYAYDRFYDPLCRKHKITRDELEAIRGKGIGNWPLPPREGSGQ